MPARKTEKENIDVNSTEAKAESVESEVKEETKKDDLTFEPERKVTVKSIANWTTGFKRIESNGDVTIPANGTIRLTASEIIAQIQNGNLLFTGTDERGSHATLYIDDKATRIEADFEDEEIDQKVITSESVKSLFSKNKAAFEEALSDLVVTRAEKHAVIDIIKKEKLFSDYEKVRAVEDYTGLRV